MASKITLSTGQIRHPKKSTFAGKSDFFGHILGGLRGPYCLASLSPLCNFIRRNMAAVILVGGGGVLMVLIESPWYAQGLCDL